MPYNNVISRTDADALIPEEVSREIIKDIPTQSKVLAMATKLPNMSSKQRKMPILSTLPYTYFVNGDTGLKQTSNVEWQNKFIVAEEIAVIVPIAEAVLDDADYDVWGEVQPLIAEAFAAKIDTSILTNGDGDAPSEWPDDLLTACTAASHSVDLSSIEGAGGDLYDAVMGTSGVLAKIEDDGFMATGHIAAMSMRAKLRALRDGTGQPIFMRSMNNGQNMQTASRYELDGAPIEFLDNGSVLPTDALDFVGDWRKLVYAMRQDITYTISNQAVITDVAGNIIYNLFQQDMVALRAVLRMGWNVPNPVKRINTDEATRFPFAVLVP